MTLSRQLADLTSAGATTLATLDDIGDVNLTGLSDGKVLYRDGTSSLWKPAWANPKDATADLRDFMDALYGAGVWVQRTAVGNGSDIGPAIKNACDAIRSRYGRGKVIIPPGAWTMTTPPAAASLSGNLIEGVGTSIGTNIFFNNAAGVAFQFTGAGGYTGGGLRKIAMFIESNAGDSLSTAVLLQGDSTYQPDQFMIEDMYVTTANSSAYWYNGLVLNGQSRTSPQGVRILDVKNYQQFQCRNIGIGIYNVVQGTFTNIGTYTGKSTGNNIYIGGGGSSSTNTTQVSIDGMVCSGELNLTNATKVSIQGIATTIGAGTSFDLYWLDVDHGGLVGSLGPSGYTRFL